MGTQEATVIILNIGKSTNFTINDGTTTIDDKKTFFTEAKKCARKILEHKIFCRPRDEVALFLMGANESRNELYTEYEGYTNICCAFNLEKVKWSMLHLLDREIIQPTINESDWIDSLIVAMDLLRTQTIGKKMALKIVLITTFSQKVNVMHLESVINGLQSMNIQLVVINHNVENIKSSSNPDQNDDDQDEIAFSQFNAKTSEQQFSEQTIRQVLLETSGDLCNFEQALVEIIRVERKLKRLMPWNCELEIGSKIRINISAYIWIKEQTGLESWKIEAHNAPCKMKTEYFHNDEQIDYEEIMENIIKGYMYGATPVPYDESMGIKKLHDTFTKSLQVHGFIALSQLKYEYFVGDGIRCIVAQKNSPAAETKLTALENVLKKLDYGMLARYSYRNGTPTKLVLIASPSFDKFVLPKSILKSGRIRGHLQMHEILFGDSEVLTLLPKLSGMTHRPTAKQLSIAEKLLDQMDLTKIIDDDDDGKETPATLNNELKTSATKEEKFNLRNLLNPSLQHTYRTMTNRALYPSCPIQKLDQDLLDLLKPPVAIQKSIVKHLAEELKLNFPLELVKKPEKELLLSKFKGISSQAGGGGESMDNNNGAAAVISTIPHDDDNGRRIIEIGSVSPAEDFGLLLNRGEPFVTLSRQIQSVINDLVFKTVVIPTIKVARAMLICREESKLMGAFRYNEWIREFKRMLLIRNKMDFWQTVIVDERLGLISAGDSELSTITAVEAEEFYLIGITEHTSITDGNAGDDDDDNVDDLLDDM